MKKFHELEDRKCDGGGCGHFGAPRGSRNHNGVDLLAEPGEAIPSPVTGTVTKLGYPYGDARRNHMRYVQITATGRDFRVFYVDPQVKVGDKIRKDTQIGNAQDVAALYSAGMKNHVHFEIKNGGNYIDPTPVLSVMRS